MLLATNKLVLYRSQHKRCDVDVLSTMATAVITILVTLLPSSRLCLGLNPKPCTMDAVQ